MVDRGMVVVHQSEAEALTAIAAEAAQAAEAPGELATTVGTNAQAQAVNEAARAERVLAGAVDDRRVAAGMEGVRIGAGDRITTRRNDPDLGGSNRENWTVTPYSVEASSPSTAGAGSHCPGLLGPGGPAPSPRPESGGGFVDFVRTSARRPVRRNTPGPVPDGQKEPEDRPGPAIRCLIESLIKLSLGNGWRPWRRPPPTAGKAPTPSSPAVLRASPGTEALATPGPLPAAGAVGMVPRRGQYV